VRNLFIAVLASFLLRVVVVLWRSRSWFYAEDDWDYITRTQWSDVLDPHRGHLNWVTSVWAYVARGIVGLDYWPGYALFAAIAWGLVGLAAWYVWRRRDVDPRWAAAGAILLMWLGTAAWIQFGHAGQGFGAAATILAIHLDDKQLRIRYVIPNLLLSLLAAFAASPAALATILRAGWSLLYRKWNGVVAAGIASFLYMVARTILAQAGTGTLLKGLKGLAGPFTAINAGLELIGVGVREVIPWPRSLAWLLGLIVVVAGVYTIKAAKFSYFATVLVGGGAVYVLSALITRFLGNPTKLDLIVSSQWSGVTSPRFGSVFLTYLIVAAVPLVASQKFRTTALWWGVGGVMAVMLGFGLVQSADMWDAIQEKSEHPQASWSGQLVALRASGEPGYPSGSNKFHPKLSNFLGMDAADYIIESGLTESLLASDIYRVGDVPDITDNQARARLRMNVRPRLDPYGDWPDLGATIKRRCIRIEGTRSFRVVDAARFALERVDKNDVKLKWVDEWGKGTLTVSNQYWTGGKGVVGVEVDGPQPGAERGKLVVESDAVNMCFG
jgi:hypothetical protein